MVVVGNLGSWSCFCWISLRTEKGLLRSNMSGVIAATRLRTVASELRSNSRRLAMETRFASTASATLASWEPEREAAMTAISEAFSRANENQSFCSAVSLFSAARVTGVWRRDEEDALPERSY